MEKKISNTNIENKEIPIELRVRIDGGRRMADLAEELKTGGTVQFIATKNFDLWLSDMGHDRLRSRNGICNDDVKTTGAAWIQGGVLEVSYYDSVPDAERLAIRKELEAMA